MSEAYAILIYGHKVDHVGTDVENRPYLYPWQGYPKPVGLLSKNMLTQPDDARGPSRHSHSCRQTLMNFVEHKDCA